MCQVVGAKGRDSMNKLVGFLSFHSPIIRLFSSLVGTPLQLPLTVTTLTEESPRLLPAVADEAWLLTGSFNQPLLSVKQVIIGP